MGYSAEQLRETWRHMEALVAAGRVRSIGISNIGVNRLRRLVEDPSVQIEPSAIQASKAPSLLSCPCTAAHPRAPLQTAFDLAHCVPTD